jgi:hypothetical protein
MHAYMYRLSILSSSMEYVGVPHAHARAHLSMYHYTYTACSAFYVSALILRDPLLATEALAWAVTQGRYNCCKQTTFLYVRSCEHMCTTVGWVAIVPAWWLLHTNVFVASRR